MELTGEQSCEQVVFSLLGVRIKENPEGGEDKDEEERCSTSLYNNALYIERRPYMLVYICHIKHTTYIYVIYT